MYRETDREIVGEQRGKEKEIDAERKRERDPDRVTGV